MSTDDARRYRDKHRRSLVRRIANHFELRAVRAGLADLVPEPQTARLLDAPCGAGRLVPLLSLFARRIVGADRSGAMVDEARADPRVAAASAHFLVASADRLPFPDDAFDVVVCHRFLYHVTAGADRARVVGELARVARRGVLLAFIDADSRKMRRRRRRGRTSSRVACTRAELDAEVAPYGLVPTGRTRRGAGPFSTIAVAPYAVTS